jgi:hypothetical protein
MGIKQSIPFQRNYRQDSSCPFYGWQARFEGSDDSIASWMPEGVSRTDKVTWVSKKMAGTELTIRIAPWSYNV